MSSIMRYLTAIILVLVLHGFSSSTDLKNDVQHPIGVYPTTSTQRVVAYKRPIPVINWQNIRPPYDWWPFFRGVENHPFHCRAAGLDMLNAWWLIEASTLVYSEPQVVEETFSCTGLPVLRLFDAKSSQCFVASNDEFIIVAFRGTEIRLRNKQPDYADIAYDLLTDVQISLVPFDSGGLVHDGFKQALDSVWWDHELEGRPIKGLKSYLDVLSNQKERPVWFTGHSLGAALATLAAERYGKVQGLYTFGSPRVGDLEFKDHCKAKHFRLVNDDDIVTQVPPEGFSYRHVGDLIVIDRNGQVVRTALQVDNRPGLVKDSYGAIVKEVEQARRKHSGNIPSWLLNHVPVLYSTHIWNNYVQGQ